MANFQNLQKNSIREKANARDYAITKFAEEIVANIDVLKIALDSIPEAKRSPPDATGDAADLKSLWQGVKMMMGELEKTLSRQGIKPFDPMGEKFDPNRHEALFQTAVAGKEPGTVFMTQRKVCLLRRFQEGSVGTSEIVIDSGLDDKRSPTASGGSWCCKAE